MSRTAVIWLPAGEPGWPLAEVAGLSIVERSLMGLKAAGVTAVHLMCDSSVLAQVEEHLTDRLRDRRLPHIHLHSAGRGRPEGLDGPLVALDGRRVYHLNLLREVAGRDEAVGYRLTDGSSAGIGVLTGGPWTGLEALEGLPPEPIPDGTFAQLVTDPQGRKEARRLVFQSLIKPTDGWFSVHLNRPVSMSISRLLVRHPVHPNAATVVTFAVGMASGVLPAFGTYLGFALGGVLFQLASILDGVDGELARVKFLGSRLGQWLDTIGDDLTNVAYLAGVTIGVYRSMDSASLVWLGGIAVGLFLVTHGIMYWLLAVRFRSGDMFGFQWEHKKDEGTKSGLSRWLDRLEVFTRRDCYAFACMLLALAGVAWVALPAAAVVVTGTLSVMLVQILKNRGAGHVV